VPMFTCGLERSNFSFDILLSPCLQTQLHLSVKRKGTDPVGLCHSCPVILQPPGPLQSPLQQYSSAPDRSVRSASLTLHGPVSLTVSRSCIQTFLKVARKP